MRHLQQTNKLNCFLSNCLAQVAKLLHRQMLHKSYREPMKLVPLITLSCEWKQFSTKKLSILNHTAVLCSLGTQITTKIQRKIAFQKLFYLAKHF